MAYRFKTSPFTEFRVEKSGGAEASKTDIDGYDHLLGLPRIDE